jgi:seryl-tRNA synthetase
MIPLRFIRENTEKVKNGLIARGGRYLPVLEKILELDKEYRDISTEIESLRHQVNINSEKIAEVKRTAKKATEEDKPEITRLVAETKEIKEKIKQQEQKLEKIKSEIELNLYSLPNIPDDDVPIGSSENDNVIVKLHDNLIREYNFTPRDHQEIGELLDILDFKIASKLVGTRFAVYKGLGAKLERALINFMLDLHVKKHNYVEIYPPFLAKSEMLFNSGQLPKFENELYKCRDDDFYLIPTAEVSLVNLHAGEILDGKELPKKYVAYTACFRREAGSYGKDTRGLIRNHQFDKVELVIYSLPEESDKMLEVLVGDAEDVLRELELPYRVVKLCTYELGFASAKTYDLEVWMPGEKRWREISSCSNCKDFQSRRNNNKVKYAKNGKYFTDYVHILNGSGLAIGRTLAAILENYQDENGNVKIPEKLIPYMGVEYIRREEIIKC